MALRAFTVHHKLQDAEQQYLEAAYRFRNAEQKQSVGYKAAKCEMNRLEAELFRLRYSIYSKDSTAIQKDKKSLSLIDRCPEPAWSSKI